MGKGGIAVDVGSATGESVAVVVTVNVAVMVVSDVGAVETLEDGV